MTLSVFGHTDKGKKRPVNEDNYLCLDIGSRYPQLRKALFLLAVADGIGGHAGGQTASAKAVEILRETFLEYAENNPDSVEWRSVLVEAFQKANREIFILASQHQNLKGMGTTLVAAIIQENRAEVANIGDSRLYLIRDAQLEQITNDHSWKAEQLRKKVLDESEIMNSPFKNMITRSLGYDTDVEVDTFELALQKGDQILLCTDGLYGPVPSGLMMKIFRKGKDVQKICEKLIQQANRHGGSDNITGIVARYMPQESLDAPRTQPSDTVRLDDLDY